MAEIVIGPVVEQVSDYLVPRIGRQLGYLFNYRSNIDELKKQVGKLVGARERLQQWVDEANRQGREIFSDVHNWLNAAQQMIPETEEFIRNETEENRGCFHLKLRYRGSKQAKKRAGDISEKIQEAERIGDNVSHPPPPPPVIRSSSLIGYEALESRASILNQIMEALRNDDISMIGVWGMGGVGKTILIKQVAKQAVEDSFFDKVVFAYVSQNVNLANIQGEIASILGLNFDGREDEARKATRLSESLKKHKQILVILDDIWEKVDLGKIGIPFGDDHRGCKILLTSRRLRLLSKEMGSQRNFHVEHLCDEEAWSLFKRTAGDSVEKTELNSTATMVAKHCAGLPIAIVTVAKALRDEPLEVWSEALRQLTRCIETDIEGIESKIFLNLELSYNRLNSDKAKSLFLLCGLLDHGDTPINNWLRYGYGLGLFDEGISTVEEARNCLHTVIHSLKAASLLLESGDSDSREYVRMHDVVRDVARVIASKDPHRFLVKDAVELQQSRMGDGCRNCTRISLKCKDIQRLPEGLVCPNLELFLLNTDYHALEIPNTFFDATKELKVLGLSGMHLAPLPLQLHLLSNLRTLCLEQCEVGDIAIIGQLKKLQVVSFADSRIEQLPKEMMQLSDLRVLDLRNCRVQVIPRNVISSLSRLEYLSLEFSFSDWHAGEFNHEKSNASLSEFKHLSCLRALYVEILNYNLLPQDLVFDNLNRFKISVGTYYFYSGKASRSLKLVGIKCLQQVNCVSKILKRTEDLRLELWRLRDVKRALCELEKEGFVELKHLSMYDCDGIEYLANTVEGVPPTTANAFPLLEKLNISSLDDLEAVWHGPMGMGSFGNLRFLRVAKCAKLKYLIVLPTAEGTEAAFPQLQELSFCQLPELVSFNSIGTEYPTNFNHQEMHISKWPQLKILEVRNCDKVERLFQEISLEVDIDDQIQQSLFYIQKDGFANLEILKLRLKGIIDIWPDQFSRESFSKLGVVKIQGCHAILVAIPGNMIHILNNLRFMSISRCNSLKEVIQVTDVVEVETLSQLTTLVLRHLPKLKHLCQFGLDLVLENLQILTIDKCGNLINLLIPSMIKKFLQLRVLVISRCNMVEEIVGNEEGHKATDGIVFAKLQKFGLYDLPNLRSFCSTSYIFKFPLLKHISLSLCPKMDVFCEGGFSAPGLKKVKMDEEELDWEDDLNMAIHIKFMEKNVQMESEAFEELVESDPNQSDPDESDFEEFLNSDED